MTNSSKTNTTDRRVMLLCVACAVLALALIVVSALAYEWHNTMNELEESNKSLRALNDETTLTSINEEMGTANMQIASLQSENDALKLKVEEYEAILIENGLLAE